MPHRFAPVESSARNPLRAVHGSDISRRFIPTRGFAGRRVWILSGRYRFWHSLFCGRVHGHLRSPSCRLSHRQRNAGALASRHRAENLPQPIAVGRETLSAKMDLTLWLARFHCTELMGISCTSPRRGYRLSARQTGRAAALSGDQGKLLGQVACHPGTQRKRVARATAVDRVRSLLEAVLCADMTTGVVVVTYNSADVIGRCLASCRQLPVVVIDNHSEDETVSVVRQAAVQLIMNSINLGFAAAANQGVEALDTELILLLNPDVELSTSTELLAEACSRDGVGLASGKLIDETGKVQAGFTLRRFPTAWTLAFEVLGINHLFPSNPLNRRYRCLDVDLSLPSEAAYQPPGAFLMFRREVWHRMGGFDTQFHPLWFEDVDFSKRARDLGLKILYVPEVTARQQSGNRIAWLDL